MEKYYKTIIRPVISETALELIESENKLVFIVDRKANKKIIKESIEKLYEVKIQKVNTLILPNGKKKAYIRLAPEYSASEIATKLGIF
ncbi:MAG: 50S ribosomal protein L23 [Candidatus Odinarchaeia archaeon]